MKAIIQVGNYLQCPYCERFFGNGISVVYSDVVTSCTCEGMKEAMKYRGLEKRIEKLESLQLTNRNTSIT